MLNHWDHRTLLKTIDKRGENGWGAKKKVSTDRYNWWNRTDSTARSDRNVLPALFASCLSSLDLAVENQIWTKRNETERITITIRLNIRNNYTSYFTWNVRVSEWVSECASGVVCAPDSSRYVGSAKAIGIVLSVYCVHGMLWASERANEWMSMRVNHQTSQHQACNHRYNIVVVIVIINVAAVVVMFAVLSVILSMT